ncbi:MAG: hypothetical protein Q9160_008394 [Pyrenula sp. 1 TL-2023]
MSTVDPTTPTIVAFMKKASQELATDLPAPKDVFAFGMGNAKLSETSLANVLRGDKTATTSWPIPNPLHWGVGDLSVILNGKGEPAAIMKTLSFRECKFKDVEESFGLAEGEGSFQDYRQGHFRFYGLQKEKGVFTDESWVLCERFEVVYPKGVPRPQL